MEIEKNKWYLKTKTIPFVVGALGLIKKETQQQISKISGAQSLQEIKKNISNKYSLYHEKSFAHLSFFVLLLLIAAFCLIK